VGHIRLLPALKDYGYPSRSLDRTGCGHPGQCHGREKHYLSTIRIHLPNISIPCLPPRLSKTFLRHSICTCRGLSSGVHALVPAITEDTMPGELSNIIAGRVANVFNFTGPNFVTDAACASSLAALQSAVDGLRFGQFDAVLTGGVDRSMASNPSSSSARSVRSARMVPVHMRGANGFVMGEARLFSY